MGLFVFVEISNITKNEHPRNKNELGIKYNNTFYLGGLPKFANMLHSMLRQNLNKSQKF